MGNYPWLPMMIIIISISHFPSGKTISHRTPHIPQSHEDLYYFHYYLKSIAAPACTNRPAYFVVYSMYLWALPTLGYRATSRRWYTSNYNVNYFYEWAKQIWVQPMNVILKHKQMQVIKSVVYKSCINTIDVHTKHKTATQITNVLYIGCTGSETTSIHVNQAIHSQ